MAPSLLSAQSMKKRTEQGNGREHLISEATLLRVRGGSWWSDAVREAQEQLEQDAIDRDALEYIEQSRTDDPVPGSIHCRPRPTHHRERSVGPGQTRRASSALRSLIAMLTLALAMCSVACGNDAASLGTRCSDDAECFTSGLTCRKEYRHGSGQCTKSCDSSEQCRKDFGARAACVAGDCVLECAKDSECPALSYCYSHERCLAGGY